VFSRVFGFHTVGLRYFNVFGPKQNPNNPYAAVIPIFCKHFLDGTEPIIYGNGTTTRDFTFVENVVQANVKAMLSNVVHHFSTNPRLKDHNSSDMHIGSEIFNVACGENISLNEIIGILNQLTGSDLTPIYEGSRLGDIKHSLASIDLIKEKLDYYPNFLFKEGLKLTYNWYVNQHTEHE
jgi:UDP-N-acetylglucosamine 4-epimerase